MEAEAINLHPNQKRPIGRQMAPTIIGGRRSSGIDLPCLLKERVKFVAVLNAMMPAPRAMPTRKAVKGS